MLQSWDKWVDQNLQQCSNKKRVRRIRTGYDKRLLVHENGQHLNFISNDYLSIAGHPQLLSAATKAVQQYGFGSTGAATLSGYTHEHVTLSQNMAQWLGFEDCLLFSSGFQLDTGLYSQLANQDTIIWLDRNCHASHVDGVILSKANFKTFDSTNVTQLESKIKGYADKRHIIICEGVLSMDGMCPYLDEIIKLKHVFKDNLLLILDDAHGIGTLGTNGRGSLELLNAYENEVDLLIGTFGKAFASHGSFVCGRRELVEHLGQTVRSQLFTTALPPCIVAATNTSLAIIQSEEGVQLRQQLQDNIAYFRQLADTYNLPLYNKEYNNSAIQLFIFNDETIVQQIFDKLYANQVLVGKMFYPTVKQHSPRIRVTISASHTRLDLKYLCDLLQKYIK